MLCYTMQCYIYIYIYITAVKVLGKIEKDKIAPTMILQCCICRTLSLV